MAKKMKTNEQNLFKQKIPQMPEGYYSGDKPNPNLRAFVERHILEHPYHPETDDYDVPAFDKPIETTKATAIYNMHTYWSKKPHDAIRQYIRHYTKPGDLVLDPFCGSGGTALAALMEGRKAIAIDRSPAATFITKNYCTPVDVEELQQAFYELSRKVKPEIDWLYETRCDRCGGKATTNYTVYSQIFECPRCMERVPLFDCVEVERQTAQGKPKTIKVCPHCYERGVEEEISTRSKKYGAIPVLVSYSCQSGCKPVSETRSHNDADEKKREYFQQYDLGKIREIEEKEIPYWYPKDRMMHVESDTEPWGDKWRAGTSNFRTVAELFTKRNLWALAVIFAGIKEQNDSYDIQCWLNGCVSGILLGVSKMNQFRPNVSYPLNIMVGTYYLPQTSKEEYILKHVIGKVDRVSKGIGEILTANIETSVLISNDDVSTSLDRFSNSTVDYIFTDPPYAGNIQYGELNFIWEAWLNLNTNWHEDEIIVNSVRGKSEDYWTKAMLKAMCECYRVLKPGRWLSLCYHDTSEGTWALIQDIMAEAGFITDEQERALFIDTGGMTYNQTQSDKVTKRDLVINFRKPKPGEVTADISITGQEDAASFAEKVRQIIRDYLNANPGSAKDRIYDEVVSRMVRSGQMEAHDFDGILKSIANESVIPGIKEAYRWYLKETELTLVDEAETDLEDAAAEVMGAYIESFLQKHRAQEGVHYSDLFEQYIYKVKDKPRRMLTEFLPDYFYKADDGTWRLPANEDEEKAKSDARAQGLSRRIKRYIAILESGTAIPDWERQSDATIAEWLRHCKRSGMYAQGRLLYEKGGFNADNLPEEQMAAAEEDYQTCCRMLARENPEPKRRSNAKRGE